MTGMRSRRETGRFGIAGADTAGTGVTDGSNRQLRWMPPAERKRKMKIGIGSDHGGYALKQAVIAYLEEKKIPYHDYGCYDEKSVDYPEYGKKVAHAVKNGECDQGIVICGTGLGISMAANKVRGIRCALCTDCFMAEMARMHNNANMLALGGRVIGPGLAVKIVDTFLNTEASTEERHVRRVSMIEAEDDDQ